jgi:hypothetical protein
VFRVKDIFGNFENMQYFLYNILKTLELSITTSQALLAHFCTPSYWEAEIGSIKVLGKPRENIYETPNSMGKIWA